MHGEACLGQPVGHLGRDRVFLLAPDQTIRLQLTQALGQDLGRNPRDRAPQHTKARAKAPKFNLPPRREG